MSYQINTADLEKVVAHLTQQEVEKLSIEINDDSIRFNFVNGHVVLYYGNRPNEKVERKAL